MILTLFQFCLIAGAVIALVAGAVWGISRDSSERPSMTGAAVLVVGGTPFRIVPLNNRCRLHGRHRAG